MRGKRRKICVMGCLWLCFHALKSSEWEFVEKTGPTGRRHVCSYCGNSKNGGHDKDCMIGNALKWMTEAVRDDG